MVRLSPSRTRSIVLCAVSASPSQVYISAIIECKALCKAHICLKTRRQPAAMDSERIKSEGLP